MSLRIAPVQMKQNGYQCTAPPVIFCMQMRYLHLCCVISNEGASRLHWFGEHRNVKGGVGEDSSTEVPHEEGPGEESMCEDGLEDTDDKDMDDEDTDDESMSSSGSLQESQCSTHFYCYRCHHPHSWAECCESEDGEDDSLFGFPTGHYSRSKGESKVGHPPAPTSSLLGVQESSSKLTEAVPEETASTVCDVLPTGSQDVVVVHVTEDELKSLD